ncbi:unnamed protein product [Coregonus sp. 'balchen']|nr:unnamed protein product [Coregonus sp. 'balchen']
MENLHSSNTSILDPTPLDFVILISSIVLGLSVLVVILCRSPRRPNFSLCLMLILRTSTPTPLSYSTPPTPCLILSLTMENLNSSNTSGHLISSIVLGLCCVLGLPGNIAVLVVIVRC